MDTYCQTTLNYYGEAGPTPVPVTINNGRTAGLSFEKQGVTLIRHDSKVTDWNDESRLLQYYDEIIELSKVETGCDWVLFYPALVRNQALAREDADLAPIQAVHSDYTEDYWEMIGDTSHPYHRIIEPSMARAGITPDDIRGAKRILTLQFWRSIGDPEMDYPLAFGNGRSFDRSELVPILVEEYAGVETNFHSFIVMPPSDAHHQWFAFPELQHDEMVMFRGFDSDLKERGEAFWTPHASFADPVPAHPKPRASVEMRAICGFR